MLSQSVAHSGHRHAVFSKKQCNRHSVKARIASPEKVAATAAAAAPLTRWEDLPTDLRNATAFLEAPNPAAPGGKTRVYLLGVSHVSKVSCDQVKRLVRAVQPEVVMVELCRERVGLLVDPDNPDRRLETWHCRQVSLDGLPDDPLWPPPQQLLDLLSSRIGTAVTTQEMEADVSRLLATGLFGKARPAAANATRGEAPQFGAVKPLSEDENGSTPAAAAAAAAGDGAPYTGEVGLQMIPPLGNLRFVVEPRKLPLISVMDVRLDSSLQASGVSVQQLQALVNETLDAAAAKSKEAAAAAAAPEKQDDPKKDDDAKEDEAPEATDVDNSLMTYLQIRSQLMSAFPDPDQIVVSFGGVESGRVEVLVRARLASDPGYLSGLEGSAAGGEGVGIDSFRPQRQSVQLSPGMLLPAEAAERLAAARAARQAERVLPPPQNWNRSCCHCCCCWHCCCHCCCCRRTEYGLWSQDEVTNEVPAIPSAPVVDFFAQLMTGVYSQIQSSAVDAVGISSGAAWRAALEAACEVGAQQVLLGDRPTDITQRRLANSISGASGGRLAAALGLLLTGVIATSTHVIPDVEAAAAAVIGSAAAGDAGIVAAAAAGALALAWPVLSPFVEVWQFSRMDGQQVEDTVAIKQPLQEDLDKPFFVWGEDALLKWPGALPPLINERDEFMAKVVAAAATGANPNVPAYIADEDASQLIWRYMVPEGATASSAPTGFGDGSFKPLPGPTAVVGVVGSAHVKGMVKQWNASLAAAGQVEQLLKVD